MAECLFILSAPLCFIVNRINKIELKILNTALTDYYSQDEISAAKRRLIEDSDKIELDGKPRLPKRQDGDNRKVREIDDIIQLVTYLDEQKVLDQLPKYVADSPDSMPYLRIVDGDLRFLIEKIGKLEDTVKRLQESLAAIAEAYCGRTQPGSLNIDSLYPLPSQSKQPHAQWADQSTMSYAEAGASDPVWARDGYDSGFSRTVDLRTDKQSTTATTGEESHDAGEFQEVINRRNKNKRRKMNSSPDIVDRNISSVGKQRMLKVVGKLQNTDSKIKASDHVIDKSVFCVSNVSNGYSCDDLQSFLIDSGIQVVSCFDCKTKFIGSKAFRVCIAAKDRELFESPDIWPENVIVRDWFFKGKSNANNGTQQH